MAHSKLITGLQGFQVTFSGVVPEGLQGQPDELIKGWLTGIFSVSLPGLGVLKESKVELVQLGIDGRPLPSGPRLDS
jgi:hypothetical protein